MREATLDLQLPEVHQATRQLLAGALARHLHKQAPGQQIHGKGMLQYQPYISVYQLAVGKPVKYTTGYILIVYIVWRKKPNGSSAWWNYARNDYRFGAGARTCTGSSCNLCPLSLVCHSATAPYPAFTCGSFSSSLLCTRVGRSNHRSLEK